MRETGPAAVKRGAGEREASTVAELGAWLFLPSFTTAAAPHPAPAHAADSVLAMANGAAGGALIWDEEGAEAQLLEEALTALMQGQCRVIMCMRCCHPTLLQQSGIWLKLPLALPVCPAGFCLTGVLGLHALLPFHASSL